MDSPATSLVVKVTCGTEALERLNQGFTVAATALASGVEVSLWLTGDATLMAVPGRAEQVDCRCRLATCATPCLRAPGSRCAGSAPPGAS